MTDQRPLLPVTQSDKKAAAGIMEWLLTECEPSVMPMGAANPLVQAFARHRLTAEQDGWQPIATADRSSDILVGRWAHYFDTPSRWCTWVVAPGDSLREYGGMGDAATHWCAMPAPPANILDSTKEAGHGV